MDPRGATPGAPDGHDARLVWRLFSPSARLLSCELRKINGHFELVVANGKEPILTAAAAELEPLHMKAADWRIALEAHGYTPSFGAAVPPPRPALGEPRAAFRGLLECADVLALTNREPATDLREHATAGLVAVELQDTGMTREIIALSREALERAKDTGNGDIGPLLKSCEALLARIEGSISSAPNDDPKS